MKNYYQLRLGRKNVYAEECRAGGYVGVNFLIEQDLTGHLPDEWKAFNKNFIPIYVTKLASGSKISAGLGCGLVWTVCKGMKRGYILICPDGTGQYLIAQIAGH